MALSFTRTFTGADGSPFPGTFSYGRIKNSLSIESEPAPISYFYIQSNKALFNYALTSSPPNNYKRGVVCSPGFLSGTDAEVSTIFSNPMSFWPKNDPTVLVFTVQIGIGFRSENLQEWVGALLEAEYAPPTWTRPWKLSAVKAAVTNFADLSPLLLDPNGKDFLQRNELKARIQGSKIIASLNGVFTAEADLEFFQQSQTVLFVIVNSLRGGGPTSHPLLESFSATSLVTGRRKSVPELPGPLEPAPNSDHFFRLPARKLLNEKKIKQIAPGQWEFIEDTAVVADNVAPFTGSKGAVALVNRKMLDDAEYQVCRWRL